MSKPPNDAIPLESLFTDPGFERNFKIMAGGNNDDPMLKAAIIEALILCAGERVVGKERHREASRKGGETTAAQRAHDKQRESIQAEYARLIAAGKAPREIAACPSAKSGESSKVPKKSGHQARRMSV